MERPINTINDTAVRYSQVNVNYRSEKYRTGTGIHVGECNPSTEHRK